MPILIICPILVGQYYSLAKREEQDIRAEFGPFYDVYLAHTGLFAKAPTAAHS